MANKPFEAKEVTDKLFSFESGVNFDIDPLRLPETQLSGANNLTVRGTFATHRPARVKIALNYAGDAALQAAVEQQLFQGATYYKPGNNLAESLFASIAGRLFQFTIGANSATVAEQTQGFNQDSGVTQSWLWQAEKWVIWNDGINVPVFFDGTTTRRSAPVTTFSTTLAQIGYAHLIGQAVDRPNGVGGVTPGWQVASINNINIDDIILVPNVGAIQVTGTAAGLIFANNVTILPATTLSVGQTLTWQHGAQELPAGRMGVYGLGRNWMALPDGNQFVASDIVGSSSGTAALNFRDAVLKTRDNAYLAGGGFFTTPSSGDKINAMRFAAILDATLGQGPLQVLTGDRVFTCNAPVDRLTWQDLTNPILTESLISNGGLGQNSTVVANSDIWFRAVDGFRSLILGRKDFNSPGNVPQSREVAPILRKDNTALLQYGSAAVFDNRLLMTANPVQSALGVYHTKVIALNFDTLSSLRGKEPAVYDGPWTDLNILQIIVGRFAGVERCFIFAVNTTTNRIELWEQLPGDGPNPVFNDNDGTGDQRITWSLIGRSLDFGDPWEFVRLTDGEIYVDQLVGQVDFTMWYQPDQYPGWIKWFSWTEIADMSAAGSQPQFRPRMGLGEPSANDCDPVTQRPFRNGYTFQFQLVMKGHCRFLGGKFKAVTLPELHQMAPRCVTVTPPPLLLPAVQP